MSAAAKPARTPRTTAPRRSKPRPTKRKPTPRASGSSIAIGAAGMAAGVALVGYLLRFVGRRFESDSAEHLALDQPHPGPSQRAPDAFRPDPTAPVPSAEREALRPATTAAPTLVRAGLA